MRKARVYFQLVESAGQSTATRFVYTLFLIVIYFILCQSCRLNENLSYTPLFTTGRCNNHPSHSNLPETNDNNDDFILFYIFIYPCVYTHFFLYKYIYIYFFVSFSFASWRPSLGACNISLLLSIMRIVYDLLFRWLCVILLLIVCNFVLIGILT